jgi:hypothetical protein
MQKYVYIIEKFCCDCSFFRTVRYMFIERSTMVWYLVVDRAAYGAGRRTYSTRGRVSVLWTASIDRPISHRHVGMHILCVRARCFVPFLSRPIGQQQHSSEMPKENTTRECNCACTDCECKDNKIQSNNLRSKEHEKPQNLDPEASHDHNNFSISNCTKDQARADQLERCGKKSNFQFSALLDS